MLIYEAIGFALATFMRMLILYLNPPFKCLQFCIVNLCVAVVLVLCPTRACLPP